MNAPDLSAAKKRILLELKKSAPIKAVRLADELGLTDVAVRQHLSRLEEDGFVVSRSLPPQGRGRPGVSWELSDAGHQQFPERHGDLTVELIAATREALGEEGLDRVIAVRTRKQIAEYRRRMPESGSLADRVGCLAEIRTDEGYMAEVVSDEEGVYVLIEHHCPICDAARACQGLCAAELEVFRTVLGTGVSVQRTAHLLGDGLRCAYRIS